MNDSTKAEIRKSAPVLAAGASTEKGARRYEPPTIQTFSGDEILQEVGPAQGYTGQIPTEL